MSTERRGLVVAARSQRFTLLDEGERWTAVVPKRLRRADADSVDPVAVGDRVTFTVEHGRGVIHEVLPRRNALSRPGLGKKGVRQVVAANLDLAVLVAAAADPPFKPATLDRYLVLASAAGISARILINKIDLDRAPERSPELAVYPALGIPVGFASAARGEGIDELARALAGVTAVFLGASGVGKSSLVNRLAPDASVRVGEVSEATGKGRHVTSWVEMIDLPGGGGVIDSPGLRVLDLTGVPPAGLGSHFPEIRALEGECRFPDCRHAAEPDCAVKAAAERGEIAPHRYDSYRRILDSLSRGEG
jgi:ribosome biogenesis GTPase